MSFRMCSFLLALLVMKSLVAAQQQKSYAEVKVADGVHTFIWPDPTKDIVVGNSTLIVGGESALVIDTTNHPSNARSIIGEIRRITDKPVRFVVNTHWHYDHFIGNQVFSETFPSLNIIAHDETLKQMDERGPRYIERAHKGLDDALQRLKRELSAGKKDSGAPLTDYEKTRWAETVKDAEAYLPELKGIKYVRPTLTFDQSMTVHLGGREVRLYRFYRGNTDGDVVAYLPKEKILFTGDLLVYPIPYSFGSYLSDWVKTLKRLAQFDAQIIVPGHGPTQRDKEYLLAVTELLESVVSQVKDAVGRGLSLEETRKTVDLEAFRKRLAGDDPARNYAFNAYFITPAIERAYKEAKGEI
jgi:cyclase